MVTLSRGHRAAPFTGLADQARQSLQWQMSIADGFPSTSTETAPHIQLPLKTGIYFSLFFMRAGQLCLYKKYAFITEYLPSAQSHPPF
jgi:hypothetical protein